MGTGMVDNKQWAWCDERTENPAAFKIAVRKKL
jgi:hypothetical protein